jgi:tetratricopeptide (TPR) repeat protein
MMAECQSVLETEDIQPASLLEVGVLLFNFGFLSQAQVCFEKARALSPNDLISTINLANLARDAGEHAEARRLYTDLLRQLPDHPVIRRNCTAAKIQNPPFRATQTSISMESERPRSGGIFRPCLTTSSSAKVQISNIF